MVSHHCSLKREAPWGMNQMFAGEPACKKGVEPTQHPEAKDGPVMPGEQRRGVPGKACKYCHIAICQEVQKAGWAPYPFPSSLAQLQCSHNELLA